MSDQDGSVPRPTRPAAEAPPGRMPRRALNRAAVLLLTAISFYFVGPSVLEVFSSWDQVSQLDPSWLVLTAACQVVAFWFLWSLQRLVLRTTRWLPVITSQLAGNAFSRVLPGGAATGVATQYRLLRSAGISTATAGSGMTAAGLLQLGTTLALPVIALPAVIVGGPAPKSLLNAAWIGAGFFVLLSALAVAVIADDRPLTWVGRGFDGLRRRAGRSIETPTAQGLLSERTELKSALGEGWRKATIDAVGRAAFDFFTLLAALAAFGSNARPSLVLLAFASAQLLGMIPLTPGGVGFVEAGLTGMLTLAGVSPGDAVSAALVYRLMSFWIPIPVGLAAGFVHQRRYRNGSSVA
ncbi:MAG TPA: lysylphosphatidylglycerol synthase transmembrane domain-containing protein [Acidimicrobiales bacterium]|nr:lysylphosphatidylglycerol synthase transmembrane domain-containing protein [Acidimicrobiales bacterium]